MNREKVDELLMSLSLGLVQQSESVYILLFPKNWEKGILDCFLLILSDKPVLNGDLRQFFDELVTNCKDSAKPPISDSTDSDASGSVEQHSDENLEKAKQDLCMRIQSYLKDNENKLSIDDQREMNLLLNEAKSCCSPELLLSLLGKWEYNTIVNDINKCTCNFRQW